ncbi:hypothetical protein NPS70_27125 [Streptomyces sp. C10-9-1]|uniref:hypothetical protein n=1 Tax=Streptomyces sp. C10-9-1 TaxID=1859285 RepID=UPI002113708B|nr:hypothetical protein [Streptomyces sp. C10-9-1]MCQ6556832.1 hypothetical protein [Streptomyces sp. C10-9-1]
MPAQRQFVWTAIPAGRAVPLPGESEPMGLVSVLLTPRLLGPATMSTVSHFGMQSWPERLKAVRLDVLRGERLLTSRRVGHVTADEKTITFSETERLAAWRALFTPGLLVRPYEHTSYGGRGVRTFPASEAAEEVRDVYAATARTHLRHRGDAPEADAGLRTALRRVSETWQTGLPPVDGEPAEGSTYRSALAQGYAFYRRDDGSFTPFTSASQAAEREFHETVAYLADHPLLLRALGLLVDLAVPATELAQAGSKELRVVPSWPDPDPSAPTGWSNAAQDDLSPRTAYVLDGQRFVTVSLPGPGATEFKRGMLPLSGAGVAPSGNARYEVMPFDVDGAVLRMVGAAASDRTQPSDDGAGVGALPALRSMGFALVERDREGEHEKQLRRAQERATATGLTSTPLTADNLLGGYRVDIFDEETEQWYSLSRRRVRYTIGGVAIGEDSSGGGPRGLLEEGYVRPDPATTGAGADDTLYVHQAVARWDGWSLVVQRPDRVVDTGDTKAGPPPLFDAVVDCDPGSLPRLRFGRDYRLRVRIADLAGGGLRSEEAGLTEEQSEAFTHHRFEPLPPPECVPTHRLADGETQELMVVRSDRDTSVAAYAAAHGHRPFDQRLLLAPKSSLELALQHDGRFDAAMGPDALVSDVRGLFEVAKRADLDVRDVTGATTVEAGAGTPAPYVFLPEAGGVLPWLADPGGTHVALNARPRPIDPTTGHPGDVSGLPKIAVWRGDWPAFQSIALRLVDAPSGCTVTRCANHRVLTVALGPAEQVTFDIPSCPKTRDVQLFGIAGWLGVDPSDPETLQHIVQGRNRLITPPRTVTLVHAVQRPLLDPAGLLTAQRDSGDTSAVLRTDGLQIHIPSTGRLDVRAEWSDFEDRRPDPPRLQKRQALVGSYDIQHLAQHEAIPTIRQEFGDTRRRRVTYHLTGVSRFQDCFPRAVAADPAACLAEGVLEVTDVPSSARPPAPKLQYAVPTFRWTRTTDGQRSMTRWRHAGGLRVFLERPCFATGPDESLAVLTWPTTSAPGDALRHISVAGRDPIWNTGEPPAVLTQDHVNATGLERADLPELQRTVGVIAHPLKFDEQGDRWYADIDLSPVVTASYFPFVRLALARYQPHTIAGLPQLSPSVQTEPLQLPPHRRLVVTRTSGRGTVAVDGLGPSGPRANVVRTELQVRDGAARTDASEAHEAHTDASEAFEEAGTAAEGAALGNAGWTTIFRTTAALGQVRELDIPVGGERPLRLVVQEFETHPSTTSETGAVVDGPGRLVYADIVPLGTW